MAIGDVAAGWEADTWDADAWGLSAEGTSAAALVRNTLSLGLRIGLAILLMLVAR